MRKIIVQSFITLDGVMQSPGGPREDPTGGFSHGGWAVNFFDESMMKFVGESQAKPFAFLIGRRTYEKRKRLCLRFPHKLHHGLVKEVYCPSSMTEAASWVFTRSTGRLHNTIKRDK